MALNPSNIGAQSIKENTDIAIRMLSTSPSNVYLSIPQTPNTLAGFYNASTDSVELYVIDPTGRRFVRVK